MAAASPLGKDLSGVPSREYGSDYQSHALEQYSLYVKMADNVSKRRQSANTYLLSANTVIAAILGLVAGIPGRNSSLVFLVVAGIAGMLLSYTWYRLIASYRQLNSGKFKVIHEMESLLPLRPYYAEWVALGQGNDPKLYRPFTSVETWIPALFFALYLLLVVYSVASSIVGT